MEQRKRIKSANVTAKGRNADKFNKYRTIKNGVPISGYLSKKQTIDVEDKAPLSKVKDQQRSKKSARSRSNKKDRNRRNTFTEHSLAATLQFDEVPSQKKNLDLGNKRHQTATFDRANSSKRTRSNDSSETSTCPTN